MIDLLKLNYKKQDIIKTEGAESTLFLLDHETFHALNLPHTFASINEGTLIAKYTYKAGQTNNIMDYSHQTQFGSIDRKMTYFWQWKKSNNSI